MSERTSTGKILYTREQLITIHVAQTERQRLKNTKIIAKKLQTKLRKRKRRKSGCIKKRLKKEEFMSSLPPIVKVAAIKRYTRDQLLSIRSFIQRMDLILVNKLRNHTISFHPPHRHY